MNPDSELPLLRLLRDLHRDLDRTADPDKVLRYTLRRSRELFAADEAGLAVCTPGERLPALRAAIPDRSPWPLEHFGAFLAGRVRGLPRNVLFGAIERRGRPWAALALRRRAEYGPGDGRILGQATAAASHLLHQIEAERLRDARSRIDRKIMEQIRPRDLFYQILHELRFVTDYDHSSAILLASPADGTLEVVAEQITWRKGRSQRIGARAPLLPAVQAAMQACGVHAFERRNGTWVALDGAADATLPAVLDGAARDERDDDPSPQAALYAPLATREGVIGVLRIASLHAGALGPYEQGVVGQFTAAASVAVQYLQRTESLYRQIIESEKRSAVANVARGVSHDLNNALGAVLPLLQQNIEELRCGRFSADALAQDLTRIESSLQTCRRIFGGMLSFARGSAQKLGQGNVRRAIDNTLAILRNGVERQGVQLALDVHDGLPLVRAGQGNLEQLILNLAANARDAMPGGGVLRMRAAPAGRMVEIVIEDNGVGIPADILPRVQEPFFTTKPEGNGLGLAICRSLVWEMRGQLDIASQVGQGTRVRLLLPVADAPAGEDRA